MSATMLPSIKLPIVWQLRATRFLVAEVLGMLLQLEAVCLSFIRESDVLQESLEQSVKQTDTLSHINEKIVDNRKRYDACWLHALDVMSKLHESVVAIAPTLSKDPLVQTACAELIALPLPHVEPPDPWLVKQQDVIYWLDETTRAIRANHGIPVLKAIDVLDALLSS